MRVELYGRLRVIDGVRRAAAEAGIHVNKVKQGKRKMKITIVDANGQKEDVGPFDVEVSEEERPTIEGLVGKEFRDVLDTLDELDDDRPDTELYKVALAFEAFGDGAELEVE